MAPRRKSGPRIIEAIDDYDPMHMDDNTAGHYSWFYAMVPRRDLVGMIGTEEDCLQGFASRMTKRDWTQWADDEADDSIVDTGYDRMESLADYWLPDPERNPIEVTYENDMKCLAIWDGHHRTALAVITEMDEVPAYVGLPKVGEHGD